MSVWLTIPSARPAAEAKPILDLWRTRGYKIALWCDSADDAKAKAPDWWTANPRDFRGHTDTYPGYAYAVNHLIKCVCEIDPDAQWFIAAGDDTEPDPTKTADEIAAECIDHFEGIHQARGFDPGIAPVYKMGQFGVMQPTGDRWHEGVGGFANAPIDRVCGSAWYGREYCRRMYRGDGPLYVGYRHMFVDEEAQEVAIKMGVLWQRRDLVQIHRHWGRGATDSERVTMRPGLIPPHLEKWNTAQHWQEAKALFTSRKAAGFPGHEPIA